ncbi:MAG: response regulator [Alphaproteobacteria bacterium]
MFAPRIRPASRPLALVVDDSEQVCMDARRIVESLGFEARTAKDGEAALQICRVEMPALILLDWIMPCMGGLDFLHALRGLPDARRATVIFLSGNGRARDIDLAMRSGASEYLMKPFDPDLIAFKLTQVGLLAA